MASALLASYKAFVRQHPSVVLNLERLLHWVAWNPERFSGSEYAYEGFNAAVGLLGIYNEAILAEGGPEAHGGGVATCALWLAAVEQVQTLVELRAIQLEQRGKMSRYGPLICLELLKAALRLRMWRSSKCTLALEAVCREDQAQHESEQQLAELLQALTKLRQRYSYDPVTAPTPEHLQLNAQMARAAAVRAAAVAPNRPPAACGLARVTSISSISSISSNLRCHSCGAAAGAAPAGAGAEARQQPQGGVDTAAAEQSQGCVDTATEQQQQQQPQPQQVEQQQQQQCVQCGAVIVCAQLALHPSSSSSRPQDASKLAQGWWQRFSSSLAPHRSISSSCGSGGAAPAAAAAEAGTTFAGSLPGSWGPPLRPGDSSSAASKAPGSGCRQGSRSSSAAAATRWRCWQAGAAAQPQPQWSLSERDATIGQHVMWAGELLHVLRPLAYVCLLKRYGLGSWQPWVASLALDIASGYGLHTGRAILGRSHAARWPAGSTLYSLALLRSLSGSRWSPGEAQELLGRRLALLRYLLRSPCYDVLTRRLLLKAVAGSRWLPGLSNLAEFAFNMIEGMQGYYTYVES